ncbi:hypothetical protein A6M14_07970 [Acinetobacter sp. Ac_877]|uniref:hypothetical protein n=1 Tax=Acinetobacter portensis TaxID=1839785 RepID=UPI00128CAEF0|nr:hypothetical protein [Acinetobacter portensis]MPW41316.1 hypothetical protein [Acinetobacter portensis]
MNLPKDIKKRVHILFYLLLSLVLIACSKAPSEYASSNDGANNEHVSNNDRLGTTWGDDVSSYVKKVEATRLTNKPIVESTLRYSAKKYTGKSVNSISLYSGKISFSIIGDNDEKLPVFRSGSDYFMSAQDGQSYQLKYENHTDRTYEIIASVDGIDVLDGEKASKFKTGYVLSPHKTLIIDGFRKSDESVASFTFGKTENSYAANSEQGSESNTGIIGVSIFELSLANDYKNNVSKSEYAQAPNAFPADK